MSGQVGMRRVGIGVYLDVRNNLHVDVPELLARFGYEDNDHNREVVIAAAIKAVNERYPGIPRTVLRDGDEGHA